MAAIHLEDLSPFGRAALKLDQAIAELVRAGEQIARLDLESDGGLDQGAKLLPRAAEDGQSVADAMQAFAQALQEAQGKADASAKLIAERAQFIQRRRQEEDRLQQKLTGLKEEMSAAGTALSGFNKERTSPLTEEDRRRIAAELERLLEPMARFIEAAQAIKADAAGSKFKRLERQADSVIDSLQDSRRKLAQALAPK